MPLHPNTYRAAARRLRKFADNIDARSKPKTARQKAALTRTIYDLSRFTQNLSKMHRRKTE